MFYNFLVSTKWEQVRIPCLLLRLGKISYLNISSYQSSKRYLGATCMEDMAATCHAEDDLFSRSLQKRYNGLVSVKMRAARGKGAWYWSHLEPLLLQNPHTGSAKALKLRCGLCTSLFSASNPSRTANEHFKRGTCPNFRNPEANSNGTTHKFRKRSQMALPAPLPPLTMMPVPSCSDPQLTQIQIEKAFDILAQWFYESCGYVSLSTINHPKFRAFLHHVGLPTVNEGYILGQRLDTKYAEAKLNSQDKLQDAMFFQLSIHGWNKSHNPSNTDAFVNVNLNLPNGNTLFHTVLLHGANKPSPDYITQVLSSMIQEVSGYDVFRCAGIVADINDVNSKPLQQLQLQHHWMVNLTCQSTALYSLLRDFFKCLPLFASTASLCHKIVQTIKSDNLNDMHISLRCLKSLPLDDTLSDISAVESVALFSCKLSQSNNKVSSSNPVEQETYDAIQDPKFWQQLDSVVYLNKLIKTLAREIELEKPCLGQCLPIWAEVKSRIKAWCTSFSIEEKPVMQLVNKRFSKNYHQAWSASYIMDPLYLVQDSSGRYLPPFKLLTSDQEKDVVKIVTRLTHNEEAHIVLMELMKWRTEGLDPVYARAVQAKERDPVTGKMKVVNPCGSRLVWETYLTEFKVLRKVAARLIFLQATSGRLKRNTSILSRVCSNNWSNNTLERAQKVMFVSLHGRLERGGLTDDEQKKDSDLFCSENEENLDDGFVATSVN